MKIKTSELEGAALDWAVAKSIGLPLKGALLNTFDADHLSAPKAYSSSWVFGGAIIEKELITITPHTFDEGASLQCCWCAVLTIYGVFECPKDDLNNRSYGKTPLIAAMRAFVTYKLGSDVDVPDDI